MTQPITEASNNFSLEIDVSSPAQIVSILEKCDEEIFEGYQDYKSIFHEDTIKAIDGIAGEIAPIFKDPGTGAVVFSGCGTSGRIGFVAARTFNEIQMSKGRPPVFHYLLAGGDKALFTSQEAPEDDPQIGVEALKKVSEGKKSVVFIGITCGLSAPYVAGQLEYCMDHLNIYRPVLLGFNPVCLARNIQIEKWNKTFLQVAERLESCRDNGSSCFILNPIVGPEPITGSSRMKSGSATKILIETICIKAMLGTHLLTSAQWTTSAYLRCYQILCHHVYTKCSEISQAVRLAGHSLQAGGNIYYVGKDSLAIMALIDASECPPTYGATLDDIRGFVESGYITLRNTEGDLSHLGKHFRISTSDLSNDIRLKNVDTVIIINRDRSLSMPDTVVSATCKKILITFEQVDTSGFDVVIHISLPVSALQDQVGVETVTMAMGTFKEISTKWCLNAVSTGAHVMIGKVYRNIMIDVKVSNNKLFHRAVGILMRLGHLSREVATDYLLRSIYDTDDITEEILAAPISRHIQTATPKDRVVPAALMAAVSKSSVNTAKQTLLKQPVIRAAIDDVIKSLT